MISDLRGPLCHLRIVDVEIKGEQLNDRASDRGCTLGASPHPCAPCAVLGTVSI